MQRYAMHSLASYCEPGFTLTFVIWYSMQLTPYRQSPDEYGINVDADVALWMDSRAYKSLPQLHQFSGFVFITPELHTEFESFRNKETCRFHSTFPLVELLHYWNSRRPVPSPTVHMYGKSYLNLHTSEVDDLCKWVYDQREKGLGIGDDEMAPMNPIDAGECCTYNVMLHKDENI